MNFWEWLQPSAAVNEVLDWYSGALVVVAAISANLFPLVYARRPWNRSFLGRALMVKAIGLALLIDVTLLYVLFGDDYPFRHVVRAVIYSIVTTGIWMQLLSLMFANSGRDLSDEHEGRARQ